MGRSVTDYEDVLRRLTVNDERFVSRVMSGPDPASVESLDRRTEELVSLAALIALDAGDAAIHARVAGALAAGASREDVVGVLLAVGPTVGSARIVGLAPRIAEALGFDVFGALEQVG